MPEDSAPRTPFNTQTFARELITSSEPRVYLDPGTATPAEVQELVDALDALCVTLGVACKIIVERSES